MSSEKRTYIYHAVFYNCLMLAAAIIAFAVSLWLIVSGRLWSEGVDSTFLFTVGLVTGSVFMSVPVRSAREGLLRDMKDLWREGLREASRIRPKTQRAWQESPAH
ncbi:MAG TPA: hypothetical protein VF544_04825 [Pyrinomonadaceae bacterium]|jgi:hypothetical protein